MSGRRRRRKEEVEEEDEEEEEEGGEEGSLRFPSSCVSTAIKIVADAWLAVRGGL